VFSIVEFKRCSVTAPHLQSLRRIHMHFSEYDKSIS
jgi:hypothetical protein